MEQEIWKPVAGYEGWYEVSSFGRLRSLDREEVNVNGVRRALKGKLISLDSLSYGYPVAVLTKDGKKKVVRIHRLVAEAFIPNPENKQFVDHIDTNRRNANVSNLRWVTAKENANNPKSRIHASIASSKKNGSAWRTIETRNKNNVFNAEKPVCQYQFDGSLVQRYRSLSDASEKTGISRANIRNAIKGRYKQSGGFLWSYDGGKVEAYFPKATVGERPVYQYSKSGVFISGWRSIADAERALCITNIWRSATIGRHLAAGGFLWRFYKKDNIFDA